MEQTPSPVDRIDDLKAVDQKVDTVEQRHNEVVDVYAGLQSARREHASEIRAHIAALHESLSDLREEIQVRIARAKRATVIMSLLGQKTELAPVENRITNQPYEKYVDKKWFQDRL